MGDARFRVVQVEVEHADGGPAGPRDERVDAAEVVRLSLVERAARGVRARRPPSVRAK